MNASQLLLIGSFALLSTQPPLDGATIGFSGYTWKVRPSGEGGPGPNHWDPGNVSLDTNGFLHLRLTQRNGAWHCAEVQTVEKFGFGRFEFSLLKPAGVLDSNVVLGLFLYPTPDVGSDGTHEIDIEFAQWGNASAPLGNFTVWPTSNTVKQETKAFALAFPENVSKHSFTRTPTNVLFEAEGANSHDKPRTVITWLFEPAHSLNQISQKPMPVHLNLWCFRGRPPGDGQQVEITVHDFRFTPL